VVAAAAVDEVMECLDTRTDILLDSRCFFPYSTSTVPSSRARYF